MISVAFWVFCTIYDVASSTASSVNTSNCSLQTNERNVGPIWCKVSLTNVSSHHIVIKYERLQINYYIFLVTQ